MLSISIQGLRRSQWSEAAEQMVSDLAKFILAGRGIPSSDVVLPGTLVQTWRRVCTDAERVQVPEPYLCATLGGPQ